MIALLQPLFVLECCLFIGLLLCFLRLVTDCLEEQLSSMRIAVSMPVMTCIEKLPPGWRSNPVPMGMADPLHVALYRSIAGGLWLL